MDNAQDLQCEGCGLSYPSGSLSCPGCNRLRYGDALKQLAARAGQHLQAGEHGQALTTWRDALELLPPGSRQHAEVTRRIEQLVSSGAVDKPATEPVASNGGETKKPRGRSLGSLAGLGTLGLLLWKFKFVFAMVLTKGKFLLLGLTKMSTLFSMLLSMGLYWTMWGWKFAVGFVLSIYVHEMGHVMALRRLGIASSPPMFIPGFGAVVRMHQYPSGPAEDARVGLAGPEWGLGAAFGCYGIYLATDWTYWAALAQAGAFINLFNLLPVWQLDGGRGFRALSKRHSWWATGAIVAAWFWTDQGLLVLLALAAAVRSMGSKHVEQTDPRALWSYIGLIGTLSWLAVQKVPGVHGFG